MTSKITKAEKFGTLVRAFFVLFALTFSFEEAKAQCRADNVGTQNWSATTFTSCPSNIKTAGATVNSVVNINGLQNGETFSSNLTLTIQNNDLKLADNPSGTAYFVVKSGTTLTVPSLAIGTNIVVRVEAGATLVVNNQITGANNATLDILGTLETSKIVFGNYGTVNVHDASTLKVQNTFQFGDYATLNINENVNITGGGIVLGANAKVNVNDATLSTQNNFKTGDNIVFSGNGSIQGNQLELANSASCGASGCPSFWYQNGCSGGGTSNFCDKVCRPNTTINVANAGTITGTASVCPGQSDVTYSVGTINNAKSYSWTVPTGATIASGSGTNQIKVSYSTSAVGGKVTVRGVACGYTGGISEFTVAVKTPPTLTNLPANPTVCAGNSVAISTITSDGTISWTNSHSTIGLAANGNGQVPAFIAANLTSADITATIQVTATKDGCTTTSSYTITVKPNPAPQVVNPVRCGSGEVTFSTVPGTYRAYRTPTTPVVWGETTVTTYKMNVTSTITFWVSKVNNGCESARVEVTATVNPLPTEPGVTGTAICDGGEIKVSASGASASENYKWYATAAAAATPIQVNGAELTRTISTTTTYYVSKYNTTTGCESARKAVTATVNTTVVAPNITISRNIPGTISPGKSVTFTATLAAAATGTYQWKIGSTNVGTNSSTFTTDQLQNNDQVTCTFTPTAVCYTAKTSNTITVPVTAQNTWSGSASSDWNNVANWCGGIPTIAQDVVIPSGTNNAPIISSSAYAKNLTVNAGATLTIASGAVADFRGKVVVNGNWVESGSGTITIAGDADFSNSNGGNSLVSISALSVEGVLTFPSNGKIVMSGNGMLILGTNGSFAGTSDTKFVEGRMRKIFNSTNKFEFPLGSGTVSGKIAITPVSASPQSYFTVSYFRANPKVAVNDEDRTNPSDPDYLFKVSEVEYWTYEGSSGATAKASLYWSANSYVNENGDLSDLKVSTYNAVRGVWQGLQTSLDEGNSVQVFASTSKSISTVNAISDAGILTLGSTSTIHTLPVSISDFKLTALSDDVQIKWKSTAASPGTTFEIQRSENGFKTFETISVVEGQGVANYSYIDNEAKGPVVYYRLKQIDNDQSGKYSEIKSISFNKTSSAKIYPNPTRGDVVVDVEEIVSEAKVQYMIVGSDGVTRVQGVEVAGQDINASLSGAVQNLKVGTYTLIIKTTKTRHSIKLIKI